MIDVIIASIRVSRQDRYLMSYDEVLVNDAPMQIVNRIMSMDIKMSSIITEDDIYLILNYLVHFNTMEEAALFKLTWL